MKRIGYALYFANEQLFTVRPRGDGFTVEKMGVAKDVPDLDHALDLAENWDEYWDEVPEEEES